MNKEMDERAVFVDMARCTGCGVCVEVCPTGAICLVEGETGRYAEVDQEACRRCEACLKACPEGAIILEVAPAIEGELVNAESQPVPTKPQRREVRLARPVPKALMWLGAALAFAAREIVPRVADSMLDAWDRRADRLAAPQNDLRAGQSVQRSVTNLSRGDGGRHRHRRHGN